MSGELVTLARVLNRLGVGADTDDAADALLLLRAVSDKARDVTGRPYEGTATVYDEVIDAGAADFVLPHVPVDVVLSIAPHDWDGEEYDPYTPEDVDDGASTALAAAASVGDTNLKVDSVDDMTVGDLLLLADDQVVRITTVGTAGAGGSGVDVEPALTTAQALAAAAKEVSGSTYWRLVESDRGRVELLGARRFVRVVWRTTGVVPTYVEDMALEWVAARWDELDRTAGLTSYSTGNDSESYDAGLAGTPPPNVAATLAQQWHPVRNGVV